jgi:hypothetical protein
MVVKPTAIERTLSQVRARHPAWLLPTGLFLVIAGAFGLLIPFLGFYQDDWHPIYYGYVRGLDSLRELFMYDGRPFAALIYQAAFKIIGFRPLHWQLLALTLRALTALFTWMYLRQVWPDHWPETGSAALLFAVYPLFKLQPLSVAYTIHWTGYLLFSISIWAMLRSLRQARYALPLTLIALLASISHLLLLEYFAGVELARPVLIYLASSKEAGAFGQRIRRVLRIWWPYLAIFIAFVIYRTFFLPGPETGSVSNEPVLIYAFFASPLQTTLQLLQFALQDTTAVLYSVWHAVISPAIFDLGASANRLALLLTLVSAAFLFLYLSLLSNGQATEEGGSKAWPREALLAGLVITVLGPFPAWVTNQSITTGNPLWSDRYGLAAMAGASLVLVALINGLIASRTSRSAILSILIATSIGWHALNTNDYRRSWIEQTGFYWQLYWRAPHIAPGTALLSAGEILPRMGEYPTSFALSTLYPESVRADGLNYYFFNLEKHFDRDVEDLVQGIPLRRTAYSSRFQGHSHESLVIHYQPEQYECLWVLRPQDQEIRALPEITREVLRISDLERIQPASPYARPIPADIFGPEPAHTWCYYFQKGDLARQQRDWERVVALWQEASANGYAPGNGVEYLPFVEGFAHLGRWEMAVELTLAAERLPRMMRPALCATWDRLEMGTSASAGRRAAVDRVREAICLPIGD